jgi:hypothetical protein
VLDTGLGFLLPIKAKPRVEHGATIVDRNGSVKMNIVFVLFDNVTQLDFSGPVQFLLRLRDAKTHEVLKDGNAVTDMETTIKASLAS